MNRIVENRREKNHSFVSNVFFKRGLIIQINFNRSFSLFVAKLSNANPFYSHCSFCDLIIRCASLIELDTIITDKGEIILSKVP